MTGVGNGDGTDLSMQIMKGYSTEYKEYDFKSQNGCKVIEIFFQNKIDK